MNKVRRMHPIEFWTKEMLSKREKIEIRDGGFGRGEVRDAYVDLEDGDGYEDDAIKMKEDGKADNVEVCHVLLIVLVILRVLHMCMLLGLS